MSKRNFILATLGIFLIEWWLWPIFRGQLQINLLAVYFLAAAFLDRELRDKLGLMVVILFLAEFGAAQPWGIEVTAFLLTVLIMEMASRVVMLSSLGIIISIFWLLIWYHLFVAIGRGLDWLFFQWDGSGPWFRSPDQVGLFSWRSFGEATILIVILTVGFKFVQSRSRLRTYGTRI